MNKAELIDAIAETTGQTKSDISKTVDAFIKAITETVQDGNKVTIPGFAIFEQSERAAREGRNPANGEKIQIPAKKVVKIKAGKAFQDAVNAA